MKLEIRLLVLTFPSYKFSKPLHPFLTALQELLELSLRIIEVKLLVLVAVMVALSTRIELFIHFSFFFKAIPPSSSLLFLPCSLE